MKISTILSFFFVVLLSSCWSEKNPISRQIGSLSTHAHIEPVYENVQEVFNKRCIVCHACYDSPCQLKLTSYEGLMRGANKTEIYGQSLKGKELTRLFVDAKTVKNWRKKDFFDVIKHEDWDGEETEENEFLLFDNSHVSFKDDNFFLKYINRKYKTQNAKPSSLTLGSNSCPSTRLEVSEHFEANGNSGMPLGFPSLSAAEVKLMNDWVKAGSKGPKKSTAATPQIIKDWETRLNGTTNKEKITNRYIYEKLFLAHIQFPTLVGRNFRLVRSRGAITDVIDEIPTERPYDNPGTKNFSYRFREITSTIVYKTHTVFSLTEKVYDRINKLFYKKKWKNKNPKIPSYSISDSTNPFITFADIPLESRYQFMLDNAEFIIRNFIRGPVCFGQIALNVIRDHFWVVFANPKQDMSIKYLNQITNKNDLRNLDVPALDKNKANPIKFNGKVSDHNQNFGAFFSKNKKEIGLDYIWDGDGVNPNALLTVNRHFDSASVRRGHLGEIPKTVWLIDYSILERIWYNLVTGFSPYGNVLHQVATRIYMGGSRLESEDNFLTLYPQKIRSTVKHGWYNAKRSQGLLSVAGKHYVLGKIKSKIKFKTTDYKREIISTFWKKITPKVRGKVDKINCCKDNQRKLTAIETQLRRISNKKGKFVSYFAENTFIKITGSQSGDKVYTILRNNDRDYVNTMFFESNERNHSKDTLNIYEGYVGAYPNYFLVIKESELTTAIDKILNIGSNKTFLQLTSLYGIDRYNPRFWNYFDYFQEDFNQQFKEDAGVFDLSRYQVDMGDYHQTQENRFSRFYKEQKRKIKKLYSK